MLLELLQICITVQRHLQEHKICYCIVTALLLIIKLICALVCGFSLERVFPHKSMCYGFVFKSKF